MAKKLTKQEEEEKRRKALERERNKTPQQKKIEADEAEAKAAKKKEEENKKKQTGFGSNPFSALLRTLDTPRNIVASTVKNEDKVQGALRGLTRQDVVSGRDIIDEDKEGGIGTAIGGFGVDTLLDPMTYAGAPILKGLGKGVKKGAGLTFKGFNKIAPKTGAKTTKFGKNIKASVDNWKTTRGIAKDAEAIKTLKNQLGRTFLDNLNASQRKYSRQTRRFMNTKGFDTIDQSIDDMILGKVVDPKNKGKVFHNDKKSVDRLRKTLLQYEMDNTANIQIGIQDLADRFLDPALTNMPLQGRLKNKSMPVSTLNVDEVDSAVNNLNTYMKSAFATKKPGIKLPDNLVYVVRDKTNPNKVVSIKLNDNIPKGARKDIIDTYAQLQKDGALKNLHEKIPQVKITAGDGLTEVQRTQLHSALRSSLQDPAKYDDAQRMIKRAAMNLNLQKRQSAEALSHVVGTESADMMANIMAREGRIPGVADTQLRQLDDVLQLKDKEGGQLLFPELKEAAQRRQKTSDLLGTISSRVKDIPRYLQRKHGLSAQQASSITDVIKQNQNITKLYGKTRGSGSNLTYLGALEAQKRGYNTNIDPFESLKTFNTSILQNTTDEMVLGQLLKQGKQSRFRPSTGTVRKGYQTLDLTKFESFMAKTPEFRERFIRDMGGQEGQTLFSIRDEFADYARALAGGGKMNEAGLVQSPLDNRLINVTGKTAAGALRSDITQQLKNSLRAINSVVRKVMILSPGYHARNQIGQLANIKAAGVNIGDIKGEYWKNLQPLLPGKGGQHNQESILQFFANYDKNPLYKDKVVDYHQLPELLQQNVRERAAQYMSPAWQQDTKGIRRLLDANMQKTIQTDIASRMSLANYYKSQGHPDPYGAASKVIFSRGNFGKDNEDMLREMFLFSGFTLKNANFHMRNIQQNPQFYARTASLVRNAQQNLAPSGEVPTFSEESGRIPIPMGPNSALQLSVDMPMYSAGRLIFNPTTGVTQSLAPQYKSIIEMGTGNSTFTGLPIQNKPRAVLENFGARNPLVLADTAYTTAIGANRYEAMNDTQKNLSTLGGFIQPNYNRRDLRNPVNLLNLPGLPVTVIRNNPTMTPEEEELEKLKRLRGY